MSRAKRWRKKLRRDERRRAARYWRTLSAAFRPISYEPPLFYIEECADFTEEQWAEIAAAVRALQITNGRIYALSTDPRARHSAQR